MGKKIKTMIYVVGVLWIVVMSQLLVNRIFKSDASIMDAFIDTDTNIEESKYNLVIDYGNGVLNRSQKENVVKEIAQIAEMDRYKLSMEKNKDSSNIKAYQRNKNQEGTIEFITLSSKEQNELSYHHFILLELKKRHDFEEVINLEKSAKRYVNEQHIDEYQSTLKFTGTYQGKMAESEMTEKTNYLLKGLQAKRVDEIHAKNYDSIYGYTRLIQDSIKANGKKINVNIAVTYDEEEDKTKLCLATPVLNEDY